MSLFRTTHQIRFLALSVQRQWKCFTAQSLVHRLYPIKCMDLPQSRSPSSSLKAGANSVVRSLAVTDARKEVDAFGNLAEKDVLQISYQIFFLFTWPRKRLQLYFPELYWFFTSSPLVSTVVVSCKCLFKYHQFSKIQQKKKISLTLQQ